MDNKSVKVTNSFEQDARYLTMIFVTLKLCGVISWSWLWVISPIPLLFVFGFIIYPNVGEATPDYDPYCGFEDEYEPTKDDEGCRIPWSKVQKLLKLEGDI